jgi:hypothetical protein
MEKLRSLEALRSKMGLKPVERKAEKDVICRKCGAVMRKTGDNVYVCDAPLKDKNGTILLNKDGTERRCNYYYIRQKRG